VVVAHVVLELVAPGELLLADRAAEGGAGDAVQGGAELAAALPRVHHVLDLEQTRGHLQQPRHIDTAGGNSSD